MEALIIDPARLISDIIGYITELRTTYQSSQQPLTDDETTLHKFCVKLETVLRHEQKEKYSLLGVRKDYWNFIQECISRDDGVKHVQVLPQVRTSQGKGRAFIRYSLVKNSLADAIQRCLVRKNHLSQWYRSDAILCHPSLSTALINKLYDLNGIEFDLPCAGNELDISWPAFSRRSFVDGQSSVLGRRSSIGSMTSADFRNDRPDPLLGLASEVSSLKAVFPDERFHGQADDDTEVFDDVSIPDSAVEAPNVTEITLEISHLHQRILSWKADLESKLTKATIDVKKAHDDRKFAVQEYELKLKQLNEKYSNLTRSAADNSNAKVKELCARLTTAEEALSEREAEIQQLRREVTLAVSSSQDAQRSAIDLERQLVVSERQRSELSAECEQLGEKLKNKEYVTEELKSNLSKQKEKFNQLELMDTVSNKNIAELEGELKAKSVALQRIQESFEKVNGMVFGSFEELELELKARLTGTERDLENQREENRRLARNIVDVERQNRELVCKFTETTDKVEELENNNGMLQNTIGEFQKQLSVLKKEYSVFLSDLFETLSPAGGHDEGDGDYVEKETNRVVSKVKHLVVQVSCLHQQIDEKSIQEKQLAEHLEELEASIVKKDVEMKALNEEVDSSKKRVEFINKEKKFLEKEKLEADNKVIVLEKSEQTLRSDFSLAMQEKCKALDELSYLKEQSLLKTGVDDELCALRQQLDETVKAKEKLTTDLQNITETLEIIESEKKSLDEQLKALKENMAACQDDKVSLEHELDVTKQQLEVANEARIRAEQGQVKMQEQLEGLRCMMDQEIAALKFQLSSEAIKYETELKVLSDKTQEYTNVKDRLSELQELVVDLEARLQERNDVIQHDKQKYVSEIKHLRNEVQHCKSGFDGNKLKLRALENELLLTTKQLEEERSRQKDLKRWAEEFEVEKGLANQQYEDKIAELQADTEDLKERLVQVTREKAELWAKAHDMEHEIKVKSDDRWMDDSEVTHCLECKTEFSFLLRKHHCRVCGRIFCHGCSNNWVQTPHSRKLRRVCNHCLSADKRLLLQLVGSARETEDDAKSDINVDSLQRSESLLSAGDGSEREGLAIEENTTDGFPQPQPAPSTSTAGQPKSRSSSSTFTRPFGKREKSEKEQSVASSDSAKYTSFKTVKSSKRKTSKSSEQPLSRSPEECEYEFVDPEEEETDEQPGARVVISDSDNKADLVIPTVNQEPGEFWHVTVPPGRRHVFQVLVATPRASLHWMFTSEKKSILFGVAYKLTETKNDQESETVVPMTRSDSHLHSVKGHLDNVSAGIYLLVFDNTFSRMTSKRLFCMVRVQRKEDDEEQDSFT